jgi:hypothetical protein
MNTSISFHNVTNLEVKEVKHFPKDSESKEFYTRHLFITDSNGNTSEVTLFADNRSALMID